MLRSLARASLLLVFLLTVFFFWGGAALRFNYNFEDFFPAEDADVAFYKKFKKTFGQDNDFLLISFTRSSGIFEPNFWRKLQQLQDSLVAQPQVLKAQSALDIKLPYRGPFGLLMRPLLHPKKGSKLQKDSIFIAQQEDFRGSFFSEDLRSTALVLHTEALKKPATDSLIARLHTDCERLQLPPPRLAGKALTESRFIDQMQNELAIFASGSMLLVLLFLGFMYRNFTGVWVPFLVVILAVLWTLGLMGWTGQSLNVLTVLLPLILFVVGISDVVHLLTKYGDALRNGHEKMQALKLSVKEVGIATLLTSLTTAVGFFSLQTASVLPIRDFGLYAGLGVLLAYLLTFLTLPAVLVFVPSEPFKSKMKGQKNTHLFLEQLFLFTEKYKVHVLALTLLLGVFAGYGISLIRVDNQLMDDMPDGAALKEDFLFFETHFSGVRALEIQLSTKEKSKNFLQYETAKAAYQLDTFFTRHFGAGAVQSPVRAALFLQRGQTGEYAFPKNEAEFQRLLPYLKAAQRKGQLRAFLDSSAQTLRYSARVPDYGSRAFYQRTLAAEEFITAHFGADFPLRWKLTGGASLVDKNNRMLSENILSGLLIAFVVVAFLVGLLFRSLRMLLLALLPNVLPLVFIAAIMGFFGIKIRVSTSIIFTIAFGIAVDDTIHFMSKLKLELNRGLPFREALRNTLLATGKAIWLTSVILSAGFMLLVFSDFSGTFYTGLLVSLTLVFALFADLLFLPALLLFFQKKK